MPNKNGKHNLLGGFGLTLLFSALMCVDDYFVQGIAIILFLIGVINIVVGTVMYFINLNNKFKELKKNGQVQEIAKKIITTPFKVVGTMFAMIFLIALTVDIFDGNGIELFQSEEVVQIENDNDKQQTEEVNEVKEEKIVEESQEPQDEVIILTPLQEFGLTEEQEKTVMNLFEQCAGNSSYSIKNIEVANKTAKASGVVDFSVSTGDGWTDSSYTLKATFADGVLQRVWSGGFTYYTIDEGIRFTVDDTILTTEEKVTYEMLAENYFIQVVQNPGTADFNGWGTEVGLNNDGQVIVTGTMTCQNGLGLTLKYRYQVIMNLDGSYVSHGAEQIA